MMHKIESGQCKIIAKKDFGPSIIGIARSVNWSLMTFSLAHKSCCKG